jgi:hypothetical protein
VLSNSLSEISIRWLSDKSSTIHRHCERKAAGDDAVCEAFDFASQKSKKCGLRAVIELLDVVKEWPMSWRIKLG